MAEVYSKSGEKLIINAVREAYIQPFSAPNWLDLRIGFFLSITDKTNDDDVTGLAETISQPGGGEGLLPSDRYWIGLKTDGSALPRSDGEVFCGYTNSMAAQYSGKPETLGSSVVADSDDGIGAGTDFYWPNNNYNSAWSAMITDGEAMRTHGITGEQQHFAQDAVAAGYATLFAIKLTRPNIQSRVISMTIKRDPSPLSTDILFSNTPTTDIIEENLNAFPTSVATMGPVQLTRIPDALYFYWPFRLSRLRIHSIGLLKYR